MFSLTNLQLIILIFAILIVLTACIFIFIKLPKQKRNKAVAVALEWIVCYTESAYGNGTGEIKLRKAYMIFLEYFPKLVTIISFEQFNEMVKEALEWMKEQQDKNKNIDELITNKNI